MRERHSIITASVGKLPSFTPLRSSMTRGCPWRVCCWNAVRTFPSVQSFRVTTSEKVRTAYLSVRAKLPGYYERPGEVVECTPLGYAQRFPGLAHHAPNPKTCALLRACGAPE